MRNASQLSFIIFMNTQLLVNLVELRQDLGLRLLGGGAIIRASVGAIPICPTVAIRSIRIIRGARRHHKPECQ
jgi:hypothetical protein